MSPAAEPTVNGRTGRRIVPAVADLVAALLVMLLIAVACLAIFSVVLPKSVREKRMVPIFTGLLLVVVGLQMLWFNLTFAIVHGLAGALFASFGVYRSRR
jgi:hypothetical protein